MSTAVVLATGGFDHKIRFWDAASGQCTKSVVFGESQVNALQISRDKSFLVAGGNPQMQLFDIRSLDERALITYENHTNNVNAVGFQRDGKWLFSGSEDGSLKVWDSRSNKVTRTYDTGAPLNTVALHPNQVDLITGDQNGTVKIWDLEADKCREEIVPAVDVPVRSVAIGSDGNNVAVGSHNGSAFIYSINKKRELELVNELDAHKGGGAYVLKCVFSPDTNKLITTSSDKTIKVWNTASWSDEKTLTQHQKWVWDAVFSSDSQYLVSVSSDQTAKLWDMKTGEVIRTFAGHSLTVSCVALNDSTF